MSGKKRKKPIITLASLVLVTVLLIVAYLLYTNHKLKQEEALAAKKAAKADTSVMMNEEDAAKIASIQITKDGKNMVWNRKDSAWVLQGEDKFPADSEKVEDLANLIASLKATKIVTDHTDDLAQFGLKEPKVSVTATRDDGTTLTLNLGDQLAVDDEYYGNISGKDAVYVLPLDTNTKVNVTKADFINIEETPSLNTDQLIEIQLSTKDKGSFHIAYDKQNPYDYSGVGSYPWYSINDNRSPVSVDNTAISPLLKSYVSFSLSKGVDYGQRAMKTYGLDRPQGMIYLRYLDIAQANKVNEFVLHIGNQDESGNYYVSVNDSNIVYLMLADSVNEKLAYKEADLLGGFVHLVNITDVTDVKITTPKVTHDYGYDTKTTTDEDGKKTTNTTYTVDGATNTDVETLKNIYQSAIGIKRSGILTASDKVEGEPVITLEFNLANGKELKAEYYAYDSSSYAAVLNGKTMFAADKSSVDQLISLVETQTK